MRSVIIAAVGRPVEVELILALLLGGMMAAIAVIGLALGYRSAARKHQEGRW